MTYIYVADIKKRSNPVTVCTVNILTNSKGVLDLLAWETVMLYKINAYCRISYLMTLDGRSVALINSIIKFHFNYFSLLLMFCNSKQTNKLNQMLKPWLFLTMPG